MEVVKDILTRLLSNRQMHDLRQCQHLLQLTWAVAEAAERLAADPEGADLGAVGEPEDCQVAVGGSHSHHRVQRVHGARHKLAARLKQKQRTCSEDVGR